MIETFFEFVCATFPLKVLTAMDRSQNSLFLERREYHTRLIRFQFQFIDLLSRLLAQFQRYLPLIHSETFTQSIFHYQFSGVRRPLRLRILTLFPRLFPFKILLLHDLFTQHFHSVSHLGNALVALGGRSVPDRVFPRKVLVGGLCPWF